MKEYETKRELLRADIAATIVHHLDRGVSTRDVVMALKDVCVQSLLAFNDRNVTSAFISQLKKEVQS